MNTRALWTVKSIAIAMLVSSCTVNVTMDTSRYPDPLTAGWNGESVCEQLHRDERQRVLRCTFPPGVGHEKHHHAAHFGYVIAGGRMQISDEGGTRIVETPDGNTWTSDSIKWHEALNIGETTTQYLIVERL